MSSTTCGRCGRITHMTEHGPFISYYDRTGGSSNMCFEQAYVCDNCRRLNTRYVEAPLGEVSDIRELDARDWFGKSTWTPVPGERREYQDVPEPVAGAAAEAALCFSVGSYRAVGGLARAVVEATAKAKEIEGRNLQTKIQGMAARGLIRPHIKDAADEVRYFGNNMAHGDFADAVTAEEAAEALALMDEVLHDVFQSPARVERVRQARLAKSSHAGTDGENADVS